IFIVRTAAGVELRVGKSCRSELDRSRATLHGNHRAAKKKLACPRWIGRNFAEFSEIALSFPWILRLKPFLVRDRLLLDEFARHAARCQTVKIQEILWAPSRTLSNFSARLKASWIPPLRPNPPTGLLTCAASPARRTRPFRKL